MKQKEVAYILLKASSLRINEALSIEEKNDSLVFYPRITGLNY